MEEPRYFELNPWKLSGLCLTLVRNLYAIEIKAHLIDRKGLTLDWPLLIYFEYRNTYRLTYRIS